MCLGLGFTRAALLAEMTAAEFEWWGRVYREEPFGEAVADERLRVLLAMMDNANGGKRTPNDFEFHWARRPASTAPDTELSFGDGMKALTQTFPTR